MVRRAGGLANVQWPYWPNSSSSSSVLAAVQQNWQVLKSTSKEMKNNEAIVMAADRIYE